MNPRASLILLLAAIGCTTTTRDTIRPVEAEGRTIALRISKEIFPSSSADSVSIYLAGADAPVLGTVTSDGGSIIFTPVVHLSEGHTYEVRYGRRVVGSIELKVDESRATPKLLAVYPSGDSLAENTLKMYFKFSEPMVEGASLRHIHLIRNGTDTMRGTFLDLQPELWNEDGTILTLWLDPGRIKRDLIPNKTLGNPLSTGSNYELIVMAGWKSKGAKATVDVYRKTFVTVGRDETSPKPERWVVTTPNSGTARPLKVAFGEALDYMVALHAIHIVDRKGEPVPGAAMLGDAEKSLLFIPVSVWNAGKYGIQIEQRLEDPSGNNLERLFDQDVSKAPEKQDTTLAVIYFEVF